MTGLGQCEDVNRVHLLPVCEIAGEDLVSGVQDPGAQVIRYAQPLSPHFNTKVVVGVLPFESGYVVACELWGERFDVPATGSCS